jgi:uncharacterized protein YbjT (DUF2867 family)
MRIAIAGGTGRIGRLTIAALEKAGHQAVPLSRRAGADAYTGAGLAEALRGCDAVIDVINNASQDEAQIVDFFGTTTRNLLAAEERAGVRHHVLLSIVNVEHNRRVPHYAGKREQGHGTAHLRRPRPGHQAHPDLAGCLRTRHGRRGTAARG